MNTTNTMTQTTETTQQATTTPAETTQQASEATQQAPSQQPTTLSTETTQPTPTPPTAPKSVFLSDGKLPEPKPQPAESTAEATEDLKAQLTALQARLDAIESQRTTETRTAEVERIIAPLSDTLKAVYRRTPFATLTDEEYTQLTETIKKEVIELASADKARGAVFSRPPASNPTDGKASDKETDEVLRRLNL